MTSKKERNISFFKPPTILGENNIFSSDFRYFDARHKHQQIQHFPSTITQPLYASYERLDLKGQRATDFSEFLQVEVVG
jgi:hypothetical protein